MGYTQLRYLPFYRRRAACFHAANTGAFVWAGFALVVNSVWDDPRVTIGGSLPPAADSWDGRAMLADVRSDMALTFVVALPLAVMASWAIMSWRLERVSRYDL